MLSQETMYKAFAERDISFEGLFWTAVKTTGIFCRPGCTARMPKKENVEFFQSIKDALAHGYRACKVCHPLEKLGETPLLIKELMVEIQLNPATKFKDWDLRKKGLEPSSLRRWFKKHHGITFHAYQRMTRINMAYNKIQQGESVANAAYDTGYESLSGFNDSFKNILGVAPSNSQHTQVVNITRLETPIGPMFACANADGICLVEFTDRRMLEPQLKTLGTRLNANIIPGDNPHFKVLQQQLAEYFEGKRTMFDLPLVVPGTEFQQQVWQVLQLIPFGKTRSYKQQAIALNNPSAVRAVASANGHNRIAIIIPCHRVIGDNGALVGYGGGIWRKQWLLNHERQTNGEQLLF